jgi:hypothetical protein
LISSVGGAVTGQELLEHVNKLVVFAYKLVLK